MKKEKNNKVSDYILNNKRTIWLTGMVNDLMAKRAINQLLYLNDQSHDEITVIINTGGGSINSGMAIIDYFNAIKSPVSTRGSGIQASMGAMLLLSGEKGRRFATKNSSIMIHQPLINSKISSQTTDLKILADNLKFMRDNLYNIISERTGQKLDKVFKDCDRDNYMTAQEALDYGIIDGIIEKI